jgi:N-formylglutamate deformylase
VRPAFFVKIDKENYSVKLPFVLSIPHCGTQIPPDLRSSIALSDAGIVESVDFGTREIFERLPAAGIIAAQWSRLVVDLNRRPDQYDAKGVVALTDYDGQTVFRSGHEPTRTEIDDRVARYHRPYHDQLARLLQMKDCLGLIDCHSLNGTGPEDAPDRGRKRSDVVLSNAGDARGAECSADEPLTCPVDLFRKAAAAFEAQGFSVALNTPYRGGYIVRNYGARLRPLGRFAIQIEMNQDLYMTRPSAAPESQRIEDVSWRVTQALSAWAEQLAGRRSE